MNSPDNSRLRPDRPGLQTRRSSRPSVGLRRITSSSSIGLRTGVQPLYSDGASNNVSNRLDAAHNHSSRQDALRRRSSSEPQRPSLEELHLQPLAHAKTRPDQRPSSMPPVTEGQAEPFPALHQPRTTAERPNTMTSVVEEPGTAASINSLEAEKLQARRRGQSGGARSALGFGRGRNRRASSNTQAEYENDLVNLLDVIGKSLALAHALHAALLTRHRSRSLDSVHSHQPAEFALHPRPWLSQPTTHVYSHHEAIDHPAAQSHIGRSRIRAERGGPEDSGSGVESTRNA